MLPFARFRRRSDPVPRFPRGSGSRSSHGLRAFSLIELTAVMAIITLVAGFVTPAIKGILGGSTVDAGAAKLGGLLNLARSEAIAQHTIVRFVVATGWPDATAEDNLRRVSLWAWQAESGVYLQISNWEKLPVGLVLEKDIPDYVRTAAYAQNDASTIRGTCILTDELAEDASFSAQTSLGTIPTRYIEFLPSGSARIPGNTDRQAIFVATAGYADAGNHITHTAQSGGHASNWAQLNVDTLTGRTHIYRP
jgi:prepilin-type N-terminal cleavage/methylation domain-containing protein